MDKIRVLQFPIGNEKGGITQYALMNWAFIDRERFVFDFATMQKQLDFEDKLLESGAGVYHLSAYAEDNPGKFREEVEAILKNGYDVVHLHTSFWKSFEVEKIAMDFGVKKVIVHAHNTGVYGHGDLNVLGERHEALKDDFDLSLATDCWACSIKAGQWLFGKNIPKANIEVMHNAIDLERFTYNKAMRQKMRVALGLGDAFVIGHVGRFTHQKNHEFLIEMFEQVSAKREGAKLLLIGVGPLKEAVQKMAEEKGIISDILFLERIDNVNEVMQAMDVFVLPSRFEGLPIVLVEAQSAGLKCLASDLITTEVKLTDNLRFLPLDVDIWVENVLAHAKGYEREDMTAVISGKGYNIREQIRYIEAMYSK